MSDVLGVVYSLPFVAGAVFGAVLMKLYQWHHCRQLDKTHPLPGSVRRRVPGISQVWIGGLVAVSVLGYVLLQVGQTENRYRDLADRVEQCNTELITASNAREDLRKRYDDLSIEQRNLLTDLDQANGEWVRQITTPPPHLADLSPGDPRRIGYVLTMTRLYDEKATALRARIAQIRVQQTGLTEEIAAHPIPAPDCGRA